MMNATLADDIVQTGQNCRLNVRVKAYHLFVGANLPVQRYLNSDTPYFLLSDRQRSPWCLVYIC